jgi:hypothetical protein
MLLDQCNTPAEAERILIGSCAYLDGAVVLDYIVNQELASAASNRWVQQYIDKVWTSADLHHSVKTQS